MTEAEWDACADPGVMLSTLYAEGSIRKIRLLAAAYCRRLGTFLDPDTQAARCGILDVMERRADLRLPRGSGVHSRGCWAVDVLLGRS